MAQHIKRYGKWILLLVPIALLVVLSFRPHGALATTTFSDPWWTNTSPSPECPCDSCGCEQPSEQSAEHVSVRTGEAFVDLQLFQSPGRVEPNRFALRLRSYNSGVSELGRGVLSSWQHTVREVSLGGEDYLVEWRRPDGLIVTFDQDEGNYSTTDCHVHHTLTKNGSGRYVLTDKFGNQMLFDANGMPDTYTDRNGNVDDFTYDSSFQWTGYTDDRGKSLAIHHNSDGFIDYIDDIAGNRWAFGYDASGCLETITSPATPDQPSGSTRTLSYDGSNRLTAIEDGRENAVWQYAYVGSTGQIDTVTIDGETVDYTWNSGRLDVTDRRGFVHRYHSSGQLITKTDMWISSAAQYVTEYRYSGNDLINVVLPRGNRTDFTWDGSHNLLTRRSRTADTSTNDASDLLETWVYTNNFITSYTDPTGQSITIDRDGNGNVEEIAFPTVTNPTTQTASKLLQFNASGQVTQMTDEEGKVTEYAYGTSGNAVHLLTSVTVDPAGLALVTSYTYDANGNVATTTDRRGNVTTKTWDALRRLTSVVSPSPLGYEVDYKYDENGNVVEQAVENVDKDGNQVSGNVWLTTTWTYDNLDHVTTVIEEIDASTTRTTAFTRDEEGRVTRVTQPQGNLIDVTYNARGFKASLTRGATSAVASTREYTYDENGNLTVEEDGRDNDTTHTYDLFDRRSKTTDALGHYTQWDLDKAGRPTDIFRKSSTNVVLQRMTYYHDERGRLWKTGALRTDPGVTYSDAETVYARTKTGHVSTVTDARGKVTTFAYDNAWRRSSVTDALGNVTSWTRDGNGNPTAWSVKDENGPSDETFEYEATYDAMNRATSKVEIERTSPFTERTTSFKYDSRDNLVWTASPSGNPTRFTFDGLARMTQKEVALAFSGDSFTSALVTQWQFDTNDRLTSHTDDAGNVTTLEYDALDRMTRIVYPGNADVELTYDLEDNVTQTIDAVGNDIDDTYNVLNQLTDRAVTRAVGVVDTTSEQYTYDGVGRMIAAQDDDYKAQFTYSNIGMQSLYSGETQFYMTGTAFPKTVMKAWDAVGNKVTEAYPSGFVVSYTWTDNNQLDTIKQGSVLLANYDYLGERLSGITYGNNAWTEVSYTGFRGEVARLHHKKDGSTTALRLDYAYDADQVRMYERYGAGSQGDAFEYDKAKRLTVAWMGSSNPVSPAGVPYVKKIAYDMDDNGNRTAVTVTPYGVSPTTTAYSHNIRNQYTSVGGIVQSCDASGNLIDDGTYLYDYNYRNLLCTVRLKSTSAVVATYKYDALGRRVEKVVSGATYRYVYSGVEAVSVYTSAGTWKQDYVYDNTIDGVVMLRQADVLDADGDSNTTEIVPSWYLKNALGSVMMVLEEDRDEAVSYRYDPYGNIAITRGGTPQSSDPLGQYVTFTGRWRDQETGLMNYRSRQYQTSTGRFLQRDPMGYGPGPNLYEYVGSNPTTWTDPLGLCKTQKEYGMDNCCPDGSNQSDCKVCCEKAAQAAIRAANKTYDDAIQTCKDKYPDAYKEYLKVLQAGSDARSALNAMKWILRGTGAGKHAPGGQQALSGAIALAAQLTARNVALLRAAGNKYLDCADKADAALATELACINKALEKCLKDCEKCPKPCPAYALPGADDSWTWVLGRTKDGEDVHPNGDENTCCGGEHSLGTLLILLGVAGLRRRRGGPAGLAA